MKVFQIASVALACSLLAACSTPIRSQVSVFHELENIKGRTFALAPRNEQKNDLEYKTYAQELASGLMRYGMEQASADKAQYAVLVRYGIDKGRTQVSSVPIVGQTGIASSHTYGQVNRSAKGSNFSSTTYNTPSYGVIGSTTRTDTVYARFLQVEILDNKAKDSEGRPLRLYQGEVKSRGTEEQLSAVMPYMIEALLQDFPGKSGQPRTVEQTRH
ncbi:DUF4136 domain-containing protein [Comamonas composti]|uniref:DUF4136 domain-containing protein n=1 Tax=Comamonas composti TaxID=408558 RepID=UPI000415DEFF|nr:DUF4136 domain-containing protein [Comamonas composti]